MPLLLLGRGGCLTPLLEVDSKHECDSRLASAASGNNEMVSEVWGRWGVKGAPWEVKRPVKRLF